MLVAVFDFVYEAISDKVGSSRPLAYHNALSEIRVERDLGLFHEAAIQRWFLHSRLAVQASDLYYATVHFVIPVVALLWLFRRHPERYLRWRDTLAWTTALALAAFAVFPLMPPRFLPASFGFVDTLNKIGGAGTLDAALMKDAGNLFASMPSLHVGWALWCCLALLPVVRRRWLKALLIADPVMTVVVILASANHYLLDLVAGVAVVAAGYGLARLTPYALNRRLAPARVVTAAAGGGVPEPAAWGTAPVEQPV